MYNHRNFRFETVKSQMLLSTNVNYFYYYQSRNLRTFTKVIRINILNGYYICTLDDLAYCYCGNYWHMMYGRWSVIVRIFKG